MLNQNRPRAFAGFASVQESTSEWLCAGRPYRRLLGAFQAVGSLGKVGTAESSKIG